MTPSEARKNGGTLYSSSPMVVLFLMPSAVRLTRSMAPTTGLNTTPVRPCCFSWICTTGNYLADAFQQAERALLLRAFHREHHNASDSFVQADAEVPEA